MLQKLGKNKKLVLFILAFTLIAFYLYKKYKGKDDSEDAGNWIPETLPLAKGMQGDRILNIQKALNKRRGRPIKEDSLLGIETESAIIDAGYEMPIDESEYYEITGGLIKWVR